jgi:hypothetical protein
VAPRQCLTCSKKTLDVVKIKTTAMFLEEPIRFSHPDLVRGSQFVASGSLPFRTVGATGEPTHNDYQAPVAPLKTAAINVGALPLNQSEEIGARPRPGAFFPAAPHPWQRVRTARTAPPAIPVRYIPRPRVGMWKSPSRVQPVGQCEERSSFLCHLPATRSPGR